MKKALLDFYRFAFSECGTEMLSFYVVVGSYCPKSTPKLLMPLWALTRSSSKVINIQFFFKLFLSFDYVQRSLA
jgi:hypothetical protein